MAREKWAPIVQKEQFIKEGNKVFLADYAEGAIIDTDGGIHPITKCQSVSWTSEELGIAKVEALRLMKFLKVDPVLNSYCYITIKLHYKEGKAKRSGQPLMNHIHEGLAVLQHLKASTETKLAWCIHPMIQRDEDLRDNWSKLETVDGDVMALAMEYRRVANAYLSRRVIQSIDEIELSPLAEVNQMLIADKVQNRKDFELYQGPHPRHAWLTLYFKNWLARLSVSEQTYKRFVSKLKTITPKE